MKLVNVCDYGHDGLFLACHGQLVLHDGEGRNIDPDVLLVADDVLGHFSVGAVDERVIHLGDLDHLVGLLRLGKKKTYFKSRNSKLPLINRLKTLHIRLIKSQSHTVLILDLEG
jgi:hypothetical protein